jgi:uncharacterized repeat protein (TIGR01451 family)
MSKSLAEIARHPARFGAIAMIAVAVAMLALFLARTDTSAVHNEGLLEMDGNVAFDTNGLGADPCANATCTGTGDVCPYPLAGTDPATGSPTPIGGNPVDCIQTPATFDWANSLTTTNKGACARTASGADAGYITKASLVTGFTLPSVLVGADVICQADFVQGATDDISYHTGSDKDYQEITSSPPGSNATWHCTTSANATSKADLLNAEFVSTTVPEGGVGHKVVYIGAERDSEHGDVFNGYWIMQTGIGLADPQTRGPAGQFDCTPAPSPRNFTGQHQCGDVLVRFNYQSGGRISAIKVNVWDAPSPGFVGTFDPAKGCDQRLGGTTPCLAGDPGSPPDCNNDLFDDSFDNCSASQQTDAESHSIPGGFLCTRPGLGGDCRAAIALAGADNTDNLCGRVNAPLRSGCTAKKPCDGLAEGPGPFTTPWEPNDGNPAANVVTPPTFSEMGIDLTGLNLNVTCIAALVAESRSSPAIDATLKDFVLAPTGEKCGSSTRTEIHDSANDGTDIQGQTVVVGTVVHDHAFVTPTGAGGNATGTVTYSRWNSASACDTVPQPTPDAVETVTISPGIPSGTESTTQVPASSNYTTSGSGVSYEATYNADAPYTSSTSPCEVLFLATPSTILTKTASSTKVHSGDSVTYTYTEKNDGAFDLTSPSVSDDTCSSPAYVSGDTNNDGILNKGTAGAGETWTFTCSMTITAATTNTATGHGFDPLLRDVTFCAGTPPAPVGKQFCDQDERASATVTVITPSTVLTKAAAPVTTVTYSYTEKNNGDTPLNPPTAGDNASVVSDPECTGNGGTITYVSGDGGTAHVLDVGETWNLSCTATFNGPGTFTNVATGSAVDELGSTVTACPPGTAGPTTICNADEQKSTTVTVTVSP